MIKTSKFEITLLIALGLVSLNLNIIAQNKGKVTIRKVDSLAVFFDEFQNKISKDSFYFLLKEHKKYTTSKTVNSNGDIASMTLFSFNTLLKVGLYAPHFIEKTLEGKIIDLEKYLGKVVVLNFWFVNCKPCVAEMPQLNKVVNYFASDTNVVFFAPTYENNDAVNTFLLNHNFKYNIIPNAEKCIASYKMSSYPFNIIIDKQGKIVFFDGGGILIGKKVKNKIKELLKVKSYVLVD